MSAGFPERVLVRVAPSSVVGVAGLLVRLVVSVGGARRYAVLFPRTNAMGETVLSREAFWAQAAGQREAAAGEGEIGGAAPVEERGDEAEGAWTAEASLVDPAELAEDGDSCRNGEFSGETVAVELGGEEAVVTLRVDARREAERRSREVEQKDALVLFWIIGGVQLLIGLVFTFGKHGFDKVHGFGLDYVEFFVAVIVDVGLFVAAVRLVVREGLYALLGVQVVLGVLTVVGPMLKDYFGGGVVSYRLIGRA